MPEYTIVVRPRGDYLPETDPYGVADRAAAKRALVSEIEMTWLGYNDGGRSDAIYQEALELVSEGDLGPIYLGGFVHTAHPFERGGSR